MDSEKWLPIRHERKVTVMLDPPAHRVTVAATGCMYGVRTIRVLHRIEYNGPNEPTWSRETVLLITAGGDAFTYSELKHPPAWLEDILARAEPIDP